MKRRISLMLVLVMLVSMVTSLSSIIPVSAASFTYMKKADAIAWVNTRVGGKAIDANNDNAGGRPQCVDFMHEYASKIYGCRVNETGLGNYDASSYGIPSVSWPNFQRIFNYYGFIPQPGDIAVFSINRNHVGVVLSANAYTVTVADVYGSSSTNYLVNKTTYDYSTFTCVLRPQFSDVNSVLFSNNGTIVSTQFVKMGDSAIAPATPTRAGYIFDGWNADFSNVTKNMIISAKWIKEEDQKFSVTFVDDFGNVLEESIVTKNSSVTPPTNVPSKEGYTFIGWDSNAYENVTEDLVITALYEWDNRDLTIEILSTDFYYDESTDEYVFYGAMNNHKALRNIGIAFCLKGFNDKLLDYIIVPYNDLDWDEDSKNFIYRHTNSGVEPVYMEMYAFEIGDSVNDIISPVSKAVKVFAHKEKFETWQDEKPTDDDLVVNKRMVSSMSQKEVLVSSEELSDDELDGFTFVEHREVIGDWVEKTSTVKPVESDNCIITNSKTTYNWYHYCSSYNSRWNIDSIWVNNTSVKHTSSTTTGLPTYSLSDKGGKQPYGGSGSGAKACPFNFYVWFPDGSTTTYTYKERDYVSEYVYEKWSDWSDWVVSDVDFTDEPYEVVTEDILTIKYKPQYSYYEYTDDTSVIGVPNFQLSYSKYAGKYGVFTLVDASGNILYISDVNIDNFGYFETDNLNSNRELGAGEIIELRMAVEGKENLVWYEYTDEDVVVPEEPEVPVVYDYTINSVTAPEISIIPENGSFFVEVEVTKNTDRDARDTVVAVLYDDKGKMVDMTYMKGTFLKGQTVSFGGRLNGVKDGKVKAFVWADFMSLKPLCEAKELELN